jgi:hypothetical protein
MSPESSVPYPSGYGTFPPGNGATTAPEDPNAGSGVIPVRHSPMGVALFIPAPRPSWPRPWPGHSARVRRHRPAGAAEGGSRPTPRPRPLVLADLLQLLLGLLHLRGDAPGEHRGEVVSGSHPRLVGQPRDHRGPHHGRAMWLPPPAKSVTLPDATPSSHREESPRPSTHSRLHFRRFHRLPMRSQAGPWRAKSATNVDELGSFSEALVGPYDRAHDNPTDGSCGHRRRRPRCRNGVLRQARAGTTT